MKAFNVSVMQKLLIVISGLLFASLGHANYETNGNIVDIKIAIDKTIVDNHPELVNGDICVNLDTYLTSLERPPIGLMIMCRAFELGRLNVNIILIESPSYNRSLRMVEDGLVHTMSESVWVSDIDHARILRTTPVLPVGEFEKGVYVLADHPLTLANNDEVLDKFTGVTIKTWNHDWRIINELSSNVVPASRYEHLVNVMQAGRGDFTLLEFPQNKELELMVLGVKMKPVPGIKVVIPESRVLVVTKQGDIAEFLGQMINDGVKTLNENGETKALYQTMGFHNPVTANWRVLNTFANGINGPNS
ncbi:hypothetical protein [Agaribacter marinus]|uniref:Uncharacterized protein n=1 Tax=Agaribacter marinus TaxID=1431249 RepID=A0AA37SUN9_9ALTE|nr:hypothetical protein [Agaribacter marinus]GLR69562.1 hypothetical protein GCM10007852_04700 [Agaribacter marinus]